MRYALPLALLLTGCQTVEQPGDTFTMRGQHAALASCAYARLDKASGTGIKKVDLQGSTRLALESGGVRYWELIFEPAGANETRVTFAKVQTMWGPMPANEVMPNVKACGL